MLKRIFFVTITCLSVFQSIAQGCSDAGFCTMGAMKPDQPYNKKLEFKLRTMELSFYRGTTTLTPIVYVTTVDLNFSLNRRNTLQVKLPFQFVEGRLASTSSLGDISLCLTRNLFSSDRYDINLSVGGKIPTNSSNKSTQGLPLPMYYQTSLGTYDAIAGLSIVSRNWLFATGIQVPLNQNSNEFVWSPWDDTAEKDYVRQYALAKDLKRGIDVMLRVERNFRLSRFNFSIGLLPIYRVTRDEFTNSRGQRIVTDQAMGLALSGIVTGGYSFNTQSGLRLLLGHKIVQRELNPDGLTREFVSSLTYIHRF